MADFYQALTKELELKAAALESAVASLKDESKAIMQETLKIKSETKKLREERERMSEELLQKKHELDQLKTRKMSELADERGKTGEARLKFRLKYSRFIVQSIMKA